MGAEHERAVEGSPDLTDGLKELDVFGMVPNVVVANHTREWLPSPDLMVAKFL